MSNNYNQNNSQIQIGDNKNYNHNNLSGLNNKLYEGNDLEYGIVNVDIQKSMRLGFIRKVYGVLSFQLMITVAIMSLAFVQDIKTFLLQNPAIFWVSLALNVSLIIPLICCRSVARQVPTNYILLFLWTICESIMLGYAVTNYEPSIVMLAGIGTMAITVSLTLYACTTKTDFTICGGLLFSLTCLLLIWAIFAIFFSSYILMSLYCALGLFIYSIYLIYDTQLILGKFGNGFEIDDYIYAALTIYIDIIEIFLFLLRILGRK